MQKKHREFPYDNAVFVLVIEWARFATTRRRFSAFCVGKHIFLFNRDEISSCWWHQLLTFQQFCSFDSPTKIDPTGPKRYGKTSHEDRAKTPKNVPKLNSTAGARVEICASWREEATLTCSLWHRNGRADLGQFMVTFPPPVGFSPKPWWLEGFSILTNHVFWRNCVESTASKKKTLVRPR